MNKMHEHDDGDYIDCTGMGILDVEHRLKDYASRGNCGEVTVVSSDGASWHSIFTPARWKEFKDGVNKSARIVDVWIKEVPGGADRYGLKERRHLPFKTMKESRSHEGMGECVCCGSNEHTGMLEDFLIRDGFDVDDACEILDMKLEDIICEECYDGSKKELNDKLYSEYNDLGTDVRTGERWGESHVGAFCVNAEMKIDRKSFTEATKPSKSVLSKIKALDHVDSVSTFGSNIIVDLDTENEYEADEVSYKIEDILGNNRKHGRDDLIGAGEYHINVGTVADFSEDSYRDLDPSVRDLYQIIVEPTTNYKMRREMDW